MLIDGRMASTSVWQPTRSRRSAASMNSMFNVRFRPDEKSFFRHWFKLVPPDVYTPTEKSLHSAGDTMTFFCLIDANPEPDIRWFHRLGNDINHESDLSRQLHQGSQSGHQNGRRMTPYWSIEQEQINATRWKTSLLIKVSTMRRTSSSWLSSFSIFQSDFSTRPFSVALSVDTDKTRKRSPSCPIIIIIITHRRNTDIPLRSESSRRRIYRS